MGTGLRVSTRSGSVRVIAERRDDVEVVRGPAPEVDHQGRTVVAGSADRVVVRVPLGLDVTVGTNSGAVRLRGRLGAVAVTTGSGRVDIEAADRVDVRAGSGGVVIGAVAGEARIAAGTGRAVVTSAGSVHIVASSGRVDVGRCSGPARVRAVSGRVRLVIDDPQPDVDVETMSGRVDVFVGSGVAPAVLATTRTGLVRTDVVQGDDGRIGVRAMSGTVRVRAAT
ncbi:MAG TPA: DUF4097 family beta strand repeat-containing protein [Acidimicrobiales bacterium]|nr:DUF4097 family beta strand repeat-containing protein [Acidimicrobiales bacterium]